MSVGAQYDSELVYHNVRAEVAAQGVVYTDLESAMHGEYAEMIRTHFMHLVKPQEHKFAALHGAVWSGGSFVYVPKGVSVTIPLQSYFRLNAPGAGQFEHTLIIVDEGAYLHFIEGINQILVRGRIGSLDDNRRRVFSALYLGKLFTEIIL